ncbi:MAG: hypothetical protein V3S68_08340, partial [Dehalococcoidia bacterium]
MNKMLFAAAGLIIALAMACASAAPDPTATTVPPFETPTATATAVPQLPTQTPKVQQEWELLGIAAEGNTVTVSLHVFAGIDVG